LRYVAHTKNEHPQIAQKQIQLITKMEMIGIKR